MVDPLFVVMSAGDFCTPSPTLCLCSGLLSDLDLAKSASKQGSDGLKADLDKVKADLAKVKAQGEQLATGLAGSKESLGKLSEKLTLEERDGTTGLKEVRDKQAKMKAELDVAVKQVYTRIYVEYN